MNVRRARLCERGEDCGGCLEIHTSVHQDAAPQAQPIQSECVASSRPLCPTGRTLLQPSALRGHLLQPERSL